MEEEIRAQLEANAMAMMSWDEKVSIFSVVLSEQLASSSLLTLSPMPIFCTRTNTCAMSYSFNASFSDLFP